MSNPEAQTIPNLFEPLESLRRAQRAEVNARMTRQEHHDRTVQFIHEPNASPTAAEEDTAYKWIQLWFSEYQTRISLESRLNAKAADLTSQLTDANAQIRALESELELYKITDESLQRPPYRETSPPPSSTTGLQGTPPPTPSSLDIYQRRSRFFPPPPPPVWLPGTKIGYGPTGRLQMINTFPTQNPPRSSDDGSFVEPDPSHADDLSQHPPSLTQTPGVDPSSEQNVDAVTGPLQHPTIEQAVVAPAAHSPDSTGYRVFNPDLSFDPRNPASQRMRMRMRMRMANRPQRRVAGRREEVGRF